MMHPCAMATVHHMPPLACIVLLACPYSLYQLLLFCKHILFKPCCLQLPHANQLVVFVAITQARRCGIKQHATSSTTLWGCSITGGTHGLVVCGSSQAFLEGCKVENCGQDGIVV